MHSEILRYIDHIFCSNSSNPNLLNRVRHRVSNEMNVSLMRPFTITEVKAALFSMAPEKAPGPDGMSPAFYQHFWPVLGHDMAVFILQCVADQSLPEGLNESNIVLLPKKKVPERVTDLRPIALCNVVYKVLAKMLANRLKMCLEQVVSQSQCAFVPERLLTDNVNEEAVGTVRPSRGIRQGDPLSPYLFIICAEGLSVLLQQAEARGDIHGVRVARGAPAITHLFFTDDSLLCFRANQQETLKVKESNNLGVNEATDLGRYLGLPSALGRSKTESFRYVEEKVQERIGSWQNKLLSRAGKEVLLKSIAQAMPIFTMSMFLLPLRVCDTIEKLFNRFWWGGGGTGTRGIHWLRWSKLCEAKSRGGLGFKRLHEFNMALLAKQGWRILTNPESLVSRLLKEKYFPRGGFMEANLGGNPSYIWRSILSGQKVLKLGIARRIGDGLDTRIWDWPWLLDGTKPTLYTPCIDELKDATVSGLLTTHGTWDTAILHDIFQEEDVHRILATPVSPQFKDAWRWLEDIRGKYTVRHGYRLLMNSGEENNYVGEFHAWNTLCTMGTGGCFKWSGHAAMDQWLANATMEQSTTLAAIIWVIWSTRNDIVWRDIQPSVAAMHTQVMRVKAGWEAVNRRDARDDDRAGHASTWEPPPSSSVKCNVDAATFSDGAGYGAIIRDHTRRFIAAKNGRIMSNREPLMVEAIAAREALKWLKDLHYRNIILESDCLNFCTAFNSCSRDFSYLDVIVKQCVSIANDIGNVSVCHVRRTANRVAHELARATGFLVCL
ncbi:PREDICTED: uncharacterized protein LOC109176732 [Ipomoea nil]|uniref:uncharacterized protein LOC109176732 n=1 Tax=Ipomoea nil TaxID=35883 RepID=UPI00090097B7|nr:PREDICTED: uncharacterized protein LOC109176732 [Ipomoea nil]